MMYGGIFMPVQNAEGILHDQYGFTEDQAGPLFVSSIYLFREFRTICQL